MPIEKIRVYKWGHTPDVTAEEALLFVLDNLGPKKPLEMVNILNSEFSPGYGFEQTQDAFGRLLDKGILDLDSERFIKRR